MTTAAQRFFGSFRAVFGAPAYLTRHGLWSYAFTPLALSFVVAAGLVAAIYYFVSHALGLGAGMATAEILQYLGRTAENTPAWLSAVVSVVSLIAALVLAFVSYRALISILVAPFLGPLVEAIERIERGESRRTRIREDAWNVALGAWLGAKLAIGGLIALLVSLPTGPFQPAINIIAQSYVNGRSNFDLPFEREAPRARQRRELARNNYPEMFGNGLAALLLLLVPAIGALVSPCFGATGAAIVFFRKPSAKSAV
ncbi:MAG: EI24 domain-containing protein [Leptospirales bacterium]|nr:EI24 domain-containing protein [Leptospirales bacterium]